MSDLYDALVISPHVDDAALSMGATLRPMVVAGCRVHIVNCFTESTFAPFLKADEVSSVPEVRRQEDACFLHALGGDCGAEYLGLEDAPRRTGLGFRGILVGDAALQDVSETVAILRERLPECSAATEVFAPLGIGGHRDHHIAREASISRYGRGRITFYEDMPYACAANDRAIAAAAGAVAAALRREVEPVIRQWDGDCDWKRECCSIYKSQAGKAMIDRVIHALVSGSGERMWRAAGASGGPG